MIIFCNTSLCSSVTLSLCLSQSNSKSFIGMTNEFTCIAKANEQQQTNKKYMK